MDTNYIKSLTRMWLSPTHEAAFYGIDSWRNTYIKKGAQFNAHTDLTGSVPVDLDERVIRAISSFGVDGVRVDSIECGPVVTRVNLVLPRSVRVKDVTVLAQDIAMQLKVDSVAFTPVTKLGVLAMDIPADCRKTVMPGNVHSADIDGMALPIELGVTVTGTPKAIDLTTAPHLLIAGQTGSGKSVCINSIICSLVRNVRLGDFELMLVDPKGVELNSYKKVPNVINNKVLVNPDETLDGLRWLCAEMDRRYKVLTESGHRNIKTYNDWVRTQPVGIGCVEKMRYVVCVVDEFADLMMTSGVELTAIVQRLAQKARAVGIHLVLATQRPSVKVVTGDLKANLPCRIAFKVSTATDSVTILGKGGAEQLLGKGDMLLVTNDDPDPVRIHGVYMDDDYIAYLVNMVYRSTVDTMVRFREFVSGNNVVKLGGYDGATVPYWLMETMGECSCRRLMEGSPKWLVDLVKVHNEVWDHLNLDGHLFTMGVLVCRMARHFAEVEALRIAAEEFLVGEAPERIRTVVDSGDAVIDAMTRLANVSIIGLGFATRTEVRDAFNNKIPSNPHSNYLREIA